MNPSDTRETRTPKVPRMAPFVAARGRRPMVIIVSPADPRPAQGVVFAEDDPFIQHQQPAITTRG